MEVITKTKATIKQNIRPIILFLGLTLLNLFFLYWDYSSRSLPFNQTFVFIVLISFLIEFFSCFIIFKAKQKKWAMEKIFLILGLIVGIIYVFILPVGRAPDEESHFFRAYELSQGHFVSDVTAEGSIGSMESSDIEIIRQFKENNVTYSELLGYSNLYPDDENQSFVTTSAYSYNIFSYLPQVVGIWIGRILHLPLIATLYLAKLFNLLACLAILYYSIKYLPFLKDIAFMLVFLPITMQAMASFSPDGLVIVTATALISFILFSNYSLDKLFSKKHYALMFIICLFLSMSKIAYAPLCLLLFAIPKERFGNVKKKYISVITMGAIIFAILLLWLILAPSVQSVSDSSAQVSTILSNPFRYLAIVLHSLSANANLYLSGFFGGYLEWFNVTLSPLYIFTTFTIFIILCRSTYCKYTITKIFKIISIIVSLTLVMITFTTMFIQWTKVGETVIDGVQGRYFLPIMLLIPIWFLPTAKNPQTNSTTKAKSTTSSANKKLQKRPLPALSQNYYLYAFLVFESVYAISSIACTHIR